jgi:hypothetical protein
VPGPRAWRAVAWAAVYLAPVSLALSALLLIAKRAAFVSGPGVPSAGTEEAWAVMWLALGVVVVGHLISVPFAIAWGLRALRRGEPLAPALKLGMLYDVVVGLPLLAWIFRP